jgi:hypothetical protein
MYVAVWLGVIYDSQATNRKQGGLSAKATSTLPHSYWLPGSHIRFLVGWNKYHNKQVEALTFDCKIV